VIHFVVGTRAQLLKLAPVMLACSKRGLTWRWIYTAQHRERISDTVGIFRLPEPSHVVVDWETEARSLGEMAQWLLRMGRALPRSRQMLDGKTGSRHVVVTHGDTFTTWLGALIGKAARTPVLHVEAGLRSFRLLHPFPEELNRILTLHLADYYACPNDWALANLAKHDGEKFDTGGNTQLDTLRFGLEHRESAEITLPDTPYAVVSIHRYENIFRASRLAAIVRAVELVAGQLHVLFVQHPATRLQLEKVGHRRRLEANAHVSLLPRLDFLSFLRAVIDSEFVITDGGGNQEELSYLGKPTLILRNETERREGLGENAVLSAVDPKSVASFLRDYQRYARPPRVPEHSPSDVIAAWLEARGFGG
jgi:UDP-N-acetylglucosamine 2-epimerase (non-hydrolysing)